MGWNKNKRASSIGPPWGWAPKKCLTTSFFPFIPFLILSIRRFWWDSGGILAGFFAVMTVTGTATGWKTQCTIGKRHASAETQTIKSNNSNKQQQQSKNSTGQKKKKHEPYRSVSFVILSLEKIPAQHLQLNPSRWQTMEKQCVSVRSD